MRVAAALFLVAAIPQAAQDSLEKKVAALVEQMREDDIERRDAAVKALVALGEPARELLVKAAAGAADAEFAARITAVAEKIRRTSLGALSERGVNRSKFMAEAYGGPAAEQAVVLALAWLARHQEADGGWSSGGGKKFAADPCAGAASGVNDDGVTALAVLAFLGAGFDPTAKDELGDPDDPRKKWKPGDVARKGLDRLAIRQRKDGGVIGEDKPMYGHAIATLAFCEAAAMTGAPERKETARRAVAYLLEARNPPAAWRYTSRSGDNDTSVTGWCVAALDAATKAKIWKPEIPVKTSVMDWLDKVGPGGGRAGYNNAGTGKVFIPGKNEHFTHHETMSAISVLSRRLLAPETEGAAAGAGLDLVARDPPDTGTSIDSYYWYWGSLALRHVDAAKGARWEKWNAAVRRTVLSLQSDKGCSYGSWDPVVDRWGFDGGRIGVTALNVLTLLSPVR